MIENALRKTNNHYSPKSDKNYWSNTMRCMNYRYVCIHT